MASRGKAETEKLKQNLEDQLDRLVNQLSDLEACIDEMSHEEYVESKEETMEQLKELNDSLSKFISGDVTLVDELSAMQLAIRAAISEAFKTPYVIQMFAKRQPNQLRQRLAEVERDIKLGKSATVEQDMQKAEILNALQQLGEVLKPAEVEFLKHYSNVHKTEFVSVADERDAGEKALAMAGIK
ncbi:protein LZIC-like [Ischnura elegans]|uniref:protein LZIC-like n=1 Tax=Ischnura elegans TaxID=197161 RepID=UPI001ED86847|nr:protein LZIC-like [Ischnura elegans]